MFFRHGTDGTQQRIPLENQYAGPFASPCWIIGGGASLTSDTVEQIASSPAPRFAMNLAGAGLLRPHFWTSYDPTSRFHRSIYLDPGITKFVHRGRAMDVVPETSFKVCECPALYVFDREKQYGFQQFPGAGDAALTDWQDSLIQAIDLAYRLGFRQLFLAGTEMNIPPSQRLRKAARERGVEFRSLELLGDFVRRCEAAGMTREEIQDLATGPQYHFDETKPLKAAIQTDFHYFRVGQYLRLSRRSMHLAGLQIFSVTSRSRLNNDFPRLSTSAACWRIRHLIGDPATESTRGRYTRSQSHRQKTQGPMRDFRPHFWPAAIEAPQVVRPTERSHVKQAAQQRLLRALQPIPEIVVDLP